MILHPGWYYVRYDDFLHPVGPFSTRTAARKAATRYTPTGEEIDEFALVDVIFDNFAWGE